jgi:sugar lactone lactonase YvrE
VDASSNLYITDTFNNRIRKVTPAGIISTVAGTGTKGSSGDAGPATSAELDWPSDTALTSSGNLLIADSGRVRSVNPTGVISTIAGGGSAAVQLGPLSGISVDSAGNIFIGEPDGGLIRKISPSGVITIVAGHGRSLGFGGDSAAASEARLSHPWGLGFDAVGNLFIADTENDRIRMVSPNGIITTVVGTGGGFDGDGGPATTALLSQPRAVALDTAGNLFIADTGNNRIRKVSSGPFSNFITTVAGNGIEGFGGDGEAAVSAQLAGPSGIAVDAAGNLFITDTGNHRIRKVNSAGIITTVAGLGTPGFGGDGGPAISAQLASPSAIALDMAGNLIVADSGNNRVRKVTPAGMISTIAGVGTAGFSGDGAIATAAQLSLVGSSETLSTGLVVDAAGNIYIADTGNHRIRRVSPGGVVTTIAGSGVRGFSGDGGQAALAQLFNPSGIAMDRAGQMFVSDTFNNRVRRVTFTSETTFTIPDRGGVLLQSSGTSTAPAAGYARIQPDNTSQTPAGLAILGLRQNKARSSFPTSPPAANGPPMWF